MSAAERTHVPAPEEVMAYLDGEATGLSRAEMEAHLAACDTCGAVVANLRGVSEQVRTWPVTAAPAALQPPQVPRRRALVIPFGWRPNRVAMVGLGTAAAVLLVIGPRFQSRGPRAAAESVMVPESAPNAARAGSAGGVIGGVVGGLPEGPPPARVAGSLDRLTAGSRGFAQEQSATAQAAPPRGPMVIRTATVRIVVKEFGDVRATVEGIVSQAGGFIDQLTVNGDSATARSLTGSLRVPSDRMSAALDRLRQIGQVVEDTQGSEDVTDQIVDLDARLASARATEQRLTDLLKNRTGRLSDVLSVERELARVRLDIERLDAEKTNTTRRVTYATIAVQISEERKQGLETGALPLSTRIRVAAADGIAAALESLVGTGLFILRAGPSLIIWGIVAVGAWLALRRTTRWNRTA